MKLSPKILSIPPYVSTSWKNVASLHLENQSGDDVLVITLHSGARIEVPQLEASLIEAIFLAHTHYLDAEEKVNLSKPSIETTLSEAPAGSKVSIELFPLGSLNALGALAHDPSQADQPSLPEEILSKIGFIAQSMGIDDPNAFPSAEEECNCMRCQIARAIHSQLSFKQTPHEALLTDNEEIVSDEELSFCEWNVCQKEDKLYVVTNPLENTEQYHVHLGTPIGCTCGNLYCEHVKAVLRA